LAPEDRSDSPSTRVSSGMGKQISSTLRREAVERYSFASIGLSEYLSPNQSRLTVLFSSYLRPRQKFAWYLRRSPVFKGSGSNPPRMWSLPRFREDPFSTTCGRRSLVANGMLLCIAACSRAKSDGERVFETECHNWSGCNRVPLRRWHIPHCNRSGLDLTGTFRQVPAEDTLKTCPARIPEGATVGQRMLGEQT
jgi:hypothetical protein